jgi:cytochrome c oxidase accessory protein FixG
MLESKTPTPPGEQTESIEQDLYKKRQKIYPRQVHGLFAVLRTTAMATLLGLYYGVAWLQWDGHQMVLFDLPARKFYILGLTFWPQDFFYLSVLLIIAALSLFFFTSVAGRLWCGYACPQTVWTEIFMLIERWIEGDRRARMKLDKGPKDFRTLRIKATKHAAWLLFALWTGFTFVGYFTPIRELWHNFIAWNLGPWETFWIFFYGFATYGNAGWMREQVCIYMCPYARFQSAMFDRDTLVISYNPKRGEPRGSRKRGISSAEAGLGDCIDCTLCMQVCPTGIDIREGLQYQCIGCAACVDVCDDVMGKMGYPKGLISYTTENALEGKKAHPLRPRVIVYTVLLAVLTAGLIWGLAVRVPLEVDIIRDRNALYNETDTGLVENVYHLKVINMAEKPQRYSLSISGLPGLNIVGPTQDIAVASGAVQDVALRVQVDPVELKSTSSQIVFHIASETDSKIKVDQPARFLGPVTR